MMLQALRGPLEDILQQRDVLANEVEAHLGDGDISEGLDRVEQNALFGLPKVRAFRMDLSIGDAAQRPNPAA